MSKLLVFLASVVVLLLVIAVAALAVSKVEPVVWQPGPNPGLTGEFAANTLLAEATLLMAGVGVGPEDIAPGADDYFYTGYRDGRIVRFDRDGVYEAIANTGGVPLGLRQASDGTLIVADAVLGLLSISTDGTQTVLADSVDGEPLTFVDAVDIAADGTIWFSDASTRLGYGENILIFFEARRNGRLLSYSPQSGDVTVHVDDLFFANGVAVGPDDAFVLVSETGAGQIRRYWLKGDNADRSDLFFEGLPGAPDNLSYDDDGVLWVGIAGIRDPSFEALATKPLVRRMIGALPSKMLTPPGRHNMIIGIDAGAAVRYNLQNADGNFNTTTGALRVGDELFISNLGSDAIGVVPVPERTGSQ